jgi:hypothetical protein
VQEVEGRIQIERAQEVKVKIHAGLALAMQEMKVEFRLNTRKK